jgi:Spy/CpxP family protein refolding chaperone
MKKLLAVALSFSLFAFTSNAQVSRKSNEQNKVQRDSLHKRNGNMMKDLNLSEAQKTQLKESRESAKQQMEAIKNDASLSQDQKKEKMQELRKNQQEKMSSILTPDQKAKMQTERRDWKGKANAQKDQHKMKTDLNLSDAQKEQMKANHEAIKQQREAIKNDANLNDAQKKEKMQELYKAQKEKMNSILTTEQKAKLKADRKEWKDKNKDQKTHPKKNMKIDTKKNIM